MALLLLFLCCSLLSRCLLVCLVESGDNLIGYVVSLVGIEDVVASLAEDEGVLLVLVVKGEIVLYRVAESVVVLLCLGLELTAQTLVESLKVIALLLKRHLDRLCLLACVGILLHLLLEVGCGSLKSLLLLCESVLDILTLLLKDE